MYPIALIKHNFPNVNYHAEASRVFRRWSKIYALGAGFCFAMYQADHDWIMNRNHNSPDLKPFPAMVAPKEGLEKIADDYMLEQKYGRRDRQPGEWRKSAIVRYFMPS